MVKDLAVKNKGCTETYFCERRNIRGAGIKWDSYSITGLKWGRGTQGEKREHAWDASYFIMRFVNANAQLFTFFFFSSIQQILWILLESIIGPQYEYIKWFSSVVYSVGTKRVLFTGNKRDSIKAGQWRRGSLREELKNSLRCTVRHSSFASILRCANNVITNTQVNQLSSFPWHSRWFHCHSNCGHLQFQKHAPTLFLQITQQPDTQPLFWGCHDILQQT